MLGSRKTPHLRGKSFPAAQVDMAEHALKAQRQITRAFLVFEPTAHNVHNYVSTAFVSHHKRPTYFEYYKHTAIGATCAEQRNASII